MFDFHLNLIFIFGSNWIHSHMQQTFNAIRPSFPYFSHSFTASCFPMTLYEHQHCATLHLIRGWYNYTSHYYNIACPSNSKMWLQLSRRTTGSPTKEFNGLLQNSGLDRLEMLLQTPQRPWLQHRFRTIYQHK